MVGLVVPETYPDSPETAEVHGEWRARPVLRALVWTGIVGVPLMLASLGAMLASRLLPEPDGALEIIGWLLAVVAATALVLYVAERLMRRLLPLATLLRLSLAFPDKAPSRFAVALRASSVRRSSAWVTAADERAPTAATQAEAVTTLAAALSLHDRRTRGHCERVHALTDLVAAEMRLSEWDAQRLRWAALLHDIGKIAVPAKILNKGKPLDDRETSIMRQHPTDGARLTAPLADWMGEWVRGVGEHHERYDGTGYPNQLQGEDISRAGRIVAVTDAFDTMTSGRNFARGRSLSAARAELVRCSGSQFDPVVVRRFLDISIGRLRWTLGVGTLLAPLAALPWLRPVLAPLGGGGAATAAPALGSLAVVGGLVLGGGGVTSSQPDRTNEPIPPVAATTQETPARDGNGPNNRSGGGAADGSTPTAPPTVPLPPVETPEVPLPTVPAPELPAPPGGPVGDLVDDLDETIDNTTGGLGDTVDQVGEGLGGLVEGLLLLPPLAEPLERLLP